MDVAKAEVVIIIGANPSVNHPVASSWIKNAAANGTKLIVCDPRRSELARHAHRYLQFKPDTDVALLNAMMHVIVAEGLVDEAFIASRTIGYDELRANVAALQPRRDGADLRHRRRHDPLRRASVRHVARLDDPVGHGNLAARARHRQRALPDRALADDGADRPARHRPAPACADRTTCRARPTRVSSR